MCNAISLFGLGKTQGEQKLQVVQSKINTEEKDNNTSFLGKLSTTSSLSELALAVQKAKTINKQKVTPKKQNSIPSEQKVRKAFYSGLLDPRKVGDIHKKYNNGELHIYVDKKTNKICINYVKQTTIKIVKGKLITDNGSMYGNSLKPEKYDELVEICKSGKKSPYSILWE